MTETLVLERIIQVARTGGELRKSEESFELAYFTAQEIEQLAMHESTRLRIKHYLEHRTQPFIG